MTDRANTGTGGIIKVVLLYAAFAALWILLSDQALQLLFHDSDKIILASTSKGWLFVGITSLLLYGLMRRMFGCTTVETKPQPVTGLQPRMFLALIALAIVVLTIGSIINTFKQEKEKETAYLQAIANLRAGQIAEWLRERDWDGHFVQSSRFLAETYRKWRYGGDAASGEVLKKRLNEYRESRLFQSVLLLDEQNTVLWDSEGGESVSNPVLQVAALQARAEGRALRIGPYLDGNGQPHLDIIAPLLLMDDSIRPLVILRVDLKAYLVSALQTWPMPSGSGETLLFRRDGDQALFLNNHLSRGGARTTLRMPLEMKNLLVSQVLLGKEEPGSLVEGEDYWGVPVMGVVRTVAGTDWLLLAKMDREEVYANARRDTIWIALAGLLALFMAAAGFFLFRQHEELAFAMRERKIQAEKLRALELLDAITDGSGDVMTAKDTEGRYLLFNREAARLAGKRAQDVLGRSDAELFPNEQAASIAATDRKIMEENRTTTFQEDVVTAEGEITFLSIRGPLYDRDRNIMGTFCISRDITERRRADEERRKLEERLQRSEKMEALGTLAGGVAHDLNNVLGVVVGYAELLLDDLGELGPDRSKALEILKGGQRAAAIVQDLLTLARRGVCTREVLNLNQVVLECQGFPEFAKVLSYHPGTRLDVDLDPHLLNLSGSAVHLGKSLVNLVSNAAEAMPGGGVITIKTRNIYLDKPVSGYDEVREGDYVVLTVSDTGEGIAAGDLERVFEPFYTKKVMGRSGTGLGLPVIWGTVKDHLGYISVESEKGKGTTFSLYFPVTREEMPREHAPKPVDEYMGNGEAILVVDDVKEQRDLASTMLRKLNYRVDAVPSGEEAVEYLYRHAADLVVLDMIMSPGMDGLETYTKILEIHPCQKAIIASGFSETDRVCKAQTLGAGAYVRKPYVMEKLGLAVRKELDRR